VIERLGDEPLVELGFGQMGVVYGLYGLLSGRVLKWTADRDELLAMNQLQGLRLPNVVQVFDVFRVPLGESSTSSLGFIVRESVDHVLTELGTYPNLARLLRFAVAAASDAYRAFDGVERDSLKHSMNHFKKILRSSANEALEDWEMKLIPGIIQGIDDLEAHGIYLHDLGPSNIGLIEDRPVLFDLSYASVPEETRDLAMGRGRR
jgi:hypothetical protein